MIIKQFLLEDQGVVSMEYVIFVATAAILLIAGVAALMGAMSGYFNNWATFFNSGG